MEDKFFIWTEDELLSNEGLHCYATKILDAKYEWMDVTDVMDKLNLNQKADFMMLQDNSKMFNKKLGTYPQHKVHIELLPHAKPVHPQLYPVLHVHLKTSTQN